ncbi:MAG TPA: transcriptional regulator, partial [Chitinophagaceae bacterium]|nr:transcriptional regulator [Chitinophagaceae bacterium]
SARSLWQMIQFSVDQLLDRITLHDLVNSGQKSSDDLRMILQESNKIVIPE